MTMQRRSAAFVILAALGLFLIGRFESDTRHTLNHPEAVDAAVLVMLTLLGLTHLFIAGVMWLQRGDWLPSEASMFRWITVKALLWINLATMYVSRGAGVRLDIAFLYILIACTTIDMDVRMVGRYLLRWEERNAYEWDGETERRNGEPGRRLTDYQKGMR